MGIIGWKIEAGEREQLLARFATRWPDVIADHVTLDAGAPATAPLPPPVSAVIVGESDDGAGLQALIVAVNGSTDRPDGSTYHITWSLDRAKGRKPVDSNAVIRLYGWRPLDRPVAVKLIPARLR